MDNKNIIDAVNSGGYKYALVFRYSEVKLSEAYNIDENFFNELIEARFFNENEELRIFDYNGEFKSNIIRDDENNMFILEGELKNNFMFNGFSSIEVKENYDFDDDGQLYIKSRRLSNLT